VPKRPRSPRIPVGSSKEERERLKPRLGGHVRRDRPLGFHRAMLRGLAGAGVRRGAFSGVTKKKGSPRGGSKRRGNRPAFVRDLGKLGRRVMVKAHYHAMDAYGKEGAKLHLRYIEREGVGADGSRGVLYNRAGNTSGERFLDPIDGEQRQFRFIISPEDGHRLDLTEFTRRLMTQMEADLGRKLVWVASNHYNTDNPHTHVVVRGVDAEGKELWIPDEYLKRGMRNRASEIATEELGLRTQHDLDCQLDNELTKTRLTSVDRDILTALNGQVLHLGEYPDHPRDRARRSRMLGRLKTLGEMGLVRGLGGPNWHLKEGWHQTLKEMGQHNDIIKRMHAAVPCETSLYRIFPEDSHPSEHRRVIEGIIRRKGLHDEQRGTLFAVVETLDGHAHYVRMSRAEAKVRLEGHFIRVSQERDPWIKPADANIITIAAANRGIYTVTAHLAAIPAETVTVTEHDGSRREISAQEFVAAHVRRLRRLTYLREVKPGPHESWHVPSDLLQKLELREQTDPRSRTLIRPITAQTLEQQRRFRGPTWLDALPPVTSVSQQGLGAATAAAVVDRRRFLAGLGLDPTNRWLGYKLRELERDDHGKIIERQQGGRYVSGIRKGEKFTARVLGVPPLPSGQRVLMLVDQTGARFSLLPRKKEYAALEGRNVAVQRQQDGRLSLAPIDRGHSHDE
jgi:type IV secretory pathway VirD2 relaxase